MPAKNTKYVEAHRRRVKEAKENGLERFILMLPTATAKRITSLAGFYEQHVEDVVCRAIDELWKNRAEILVELKPERPDESSSFAEIMPSVHLSGKDYAKELSSKKHLIIEAHSEPSNEISPQTKGPDSLTV